MKLAKKKKKLRLNGKHRLIEAAAAALEPKLGKEPPVLAAFEPLLQPGLYLLRRRHLLVPRLQRVDGRHLLEVDVQVVARGHHVLVVDELDEGLDPGLLGCLLGAVLPDHLARVFGYPGNQKVSVRPVACTFCRSSLGSRPSARRTGPGGGAPPCSASENSPFSKENWRRHGGGGATVVAVRVYVMYGLMFFWVK